MDHINWHIRYSRKYKLILARSKINQREPAISVGALVKSDLKAIAVSPICCRCFRSRNHYTIPESDGGIVSACGKSFPVPDDSREHWNLLWKWILILNYQVEPLKELIESLVGLRLASSYSCIKDPSFYDSLLESNLFDISLVPI